MSPYEILEALCILLASVPLALLTLIILPGYMMEILNTFTSFFQKASWYERLKTPYVAAAAGTKLEIASETIIIVANIITLGVLFNALEKKYQFHHFIIERGWRVQRYKRENKP